MASRSKGRQLMVKYLEAYVGLASFTFWVAFTAEAMMRRIFEDEVHLSALRDSAAIGCIAAIWVVGSHVVKFTKLDDYNAFSGFLIGVLTLASAMLYTPLTQAQSAVLMVIAATLAMVLPMITRKINKYIG